jgi:hypothetical protein
LCIHRHSGTCGTETANELSRKWSVHQFVGLEQALGGSRGRMSRKRLSSGPVTSTQQSGSVLPALRERLLEKWSSTLVLLLIRPGYCPSIGHSPEQLPAFSLNITPSKDVST